MTYWVSEAFREAFSEGTLLENLAHPKKGLATTDNNRFLRFWHEVSSLRIGIGMRNNIEAQESKKKWFPLNKGGEYRRWYGNKQYVVNWYDDGREMKEAIIKRYNGGSYTKEIRSEKMYFKDSITWSALTAGESSFRFSDYGALFDSAGSSMFPVKDSAYLLGLLNTKVTSKILKFINPTLNYGAGTIANIPVVWDSELREKIEVLVDENIFLSRTDWDSFETSWDFARHPLVRHVPTIADAYTAWQCECNEHFVKLKSSEEKRSRCRHCIKLRRG